MGRSSDRFSIDRFLRRIFLDSTEHQLSSSGIFSMDLHHWRVFKRSRMICKNGILKLRSLEIELFSCQCSMRSFGHEKETKRFVFRVHKNQDAREEILAGTLYVPRSWRRTEVVWRFSQTRRKMEFYCSTNGATVQGNRSPKPRVVVS